MELVLTALKIGGPASVILVLSAAVAWLYRDNQRLHRVMLGETKETVAAIVRAAEVMTAVSEKMDELLGQRRGRK